MSLISAVEPSVACGSLDVKCPHCDTFFKEKQYMYKHIRRKHPECKIDLPGKQVCPLCSDNFMSMFDLQQHITRSHHDVTLIYEEKTFPSSTEFETWKANIERETQSVFRKNRSRKKRIDGRFVTNFVCHRSGFKNILPKDKRIRRVKCSGSIKIDSTCPANMTVSVSESSECEEWEVLYQSTHIGHKQEVGKIPLTKDEKILLAGQLHQNIPISKIISNVRSVSSPSKRLYYTHKHDLYNIVRDFKIKRNIAHSDDATSVKFSRNFEIPNDDVTDLVIEEVHNEQERLTILDGIKADSKSKSIEELKSLIFMQLQKFNNFTMQSTSVEALQELTDNLKTTDTRLSILTSNQVTDITQLPTYKNSEPANKKNDPQRRFTKMNKRKGKKSKKDV